MRGRLVEPGVLRVEVDGVPVYWAEGEPGSDAQGGLLFRVGRADETLATAGISRLVASWPGAPAEVGPVLTGIRRAGSPDDVIGFLTMAAAAITGLSADDDLVPLRRELSATPAEPTPGSTALGVRFGARGPGLLKHAEYGLSWLGGAATSSWRDRWFTVENAAAWIIAPELRGLELDLRAGVRQLVPGLPSPRRRGPIAAPSPFGSATVAVTRPPSALFNAALGTFEAAGAKVETAMVDRDVLHAAVTVPDGGQLLALPATAPDGEGSEERSASGPAGLIEWCEGELLDRRVASRAARLDARAAINRAGMDNEWRAALDTAVYLLPDHVTVADERVGPAAVWSRPPLSGAHHLPMTPDPAHPDKRMVVEPTALTLVIDRERAVRVSLAGATALRFADGSRGCWSADGFYLDLQPGEWEAGEEVVAAVDRAIPMADTVPLLRPRPRPSPAG